MPAQNKISDFGFPLFRCREKADRGTFLEAIYRAGCDNWNIKRRGSQVSLLFKFITYC